VRALLVAVMAAVAALGTPARADMLSRQAQFSCTDAGVVVTQHCYESSEADPCDDGAGARVFNVILGCVGAGTVPVDVAVDWTQWDVGCGHPYDNDAGCWYGVQSSGVGILVGKTCAELAAYDGLCLGPQGAETGTCVVPGAGGATMGGGNAEVCGPMANVPSIAHDGGSGGGGGGGAGGCELAAAQTSLGLGFAALALVSLWVARRRRR
jgi:hypothetical protein